MAVEWFEKEPGEAMTREEPDGSVATILPVDAKPNWVRLPTELGGQRVRVISSYQTTCVCGVDHTVTHLVLDEPSGIRVAECPLKGFLWYRPREKS